MASSSETFLRISVPSLLRYNETMPAERLQKIIAAAGIASRRKAEELITAGLVTVNGQTITELGTRADPAVDHIRVRGKLLQGSESRIYLMLNKPRGCVSTVHDPEGRPTVMDVVRRVGARVFPIGRLDYNSEGLLLLTNDGDLAQRLTHASFHVPKTYLVKISGKPADEAIERLRAGVSIYEEHDGRKRQVRTAPAKIDLIKDAPNPWYEITLTEGRNRQIHRMFEKIGHHVEKIKRIRYGPLALDVEPGQFRALTPAEVARLRSSSHKQSSERVAPAAQTPSRDHAATVTPDRKPKPGDRPPSFGRPQTGSRRPFAGKRERPAGRGPAFGRHAPVDDRRPAAAQSPGKNAPRPAFGKRPKTEDRRPASGDRRPSFGQPRTGSRPTGTKSRWPSPGQGPKTKGQRPSFGQRPANGERGPSSSRPASSRRPKTGDQRRSSRRPGR